MYWVSEAAKEELEKRQGDRELLAKVDKFLGNCPIPSGPNGFLGRQIASARLEDLEFEWRCWKFGLRPIFLEYPEDIFVTNNPSKTRLVRLLVLNGFGKKGGPRLVKVDLVTHDLGKLNGFPFSQISTNWGELLVQFHHRTREIVGLKGEVVDVSDWLRSLGRAREYYRYLLASSLTRGILFESFESPGFPDLDTFTQKVVLPAYQWVQKKFGCPPLIVRHPNVSSVEDERRVLNWYPSAVLKAIPEELRRGYL